MQSTEPITQNSPSPVGTSDERILRVLRHEATDRAVGIIEMYITMLGDTNGEKTAKKILEHVIKTLEHNT